MKKSAKNEVRYAVCVKEDQPWLELRKVYRVLPDEIAGRMNYIRVVDEFEEDYLYPEGNFVFIDIPKQAQRRIQDAAKPPLKSKRNKTLRATRAS